MPRSGERRGDNEAERSLLEAILRYKDEFGSTERKITSANRPPRKPPLARRKIKRAITQQKRRKGTGELNACESRRRKREARSEKEKGTFRTFSILGRMLSSAFREEGGTAHLEEGGTPNDWATAKKTRNRIRRYRDVERREGIHEGRKGRKSIQFLPGQRAKRGKKRGTVPMPRGKKKISPALLKLKGCGE